MNNEQTFQVGDICDFDDIEWDDHLNSMYERERL